MADVKRFKREGAAYLQVPVVYANYGQNVFAGDKGFVTNECPPALDQFEICEKHSAFKPPVGTEICTSRLKTEPFSKWLEHFFPDKNAVVYYGFDANEKIRIQRRASAISEMGYKSGFPLAHWERTILSSRDVGIEPPNTYACFKHANCVGCLKAGRQHWYVVYVQYRDVFERAKLSEDRIGFSIMKDETLREVEPLFARMVSAGIPATEHIGQQRFWADVRRLGLMSEQLCDIEVDRKPCECVF